MSLLFLKKQNNNQAATVLPHAVLFRILVNDRNLDFTCLCLSCSSKKKKNHQAAAVLSHAVAYVDSGEVYNFHPTPEEVVAAERHAAAAEAQRMVLGCFCMAFFILFIF